MFDASFTITNSHRSRFGDQTPDALRVDAETTTAPARLWLLELADELDDAAFHTLNDAPDGWTWPIRVPDDAIQPEPVWWKKHGHRQPGLLRVLREATGAAWTDAAAARIADLGDALERNGFECLNEAPTNWYWVPGGRR